MINILEGSYKDFCFPSGEQHVRLIEIQNNPVNIRFDFESNNEIFKLMLIVDAIRRNGCELGDLYMDYVPFGRQDRVMQHGEPLSIKVFADLINAMKFKKVHIYDAHSSVTMALIDNCKEVDQSTVFNRVLHDFGHHYLISPDGGALKKIYENVIMSTVGVIECSKNRNVRTGQITGVKVHCDDINKMTCVIMDDICDGGRTFIEIAKELKKKNAGKIILCVTHGLFTKGLDVFNDLIDEIYTKEGRLIK